MKTLFKKTRLLFLIALIFVTIIHFTIKDVFFITGVFFYAFPLPLLIFGFILLGIAYLNRPRYAYTIFTTTLILTLICFKANYRNYESTDIAIPTKTILYWNVAKQKDNNWDVLEGVLKLHNIDIIILLEAKELSIEKSTNLKNILPNYQTLYLRGNMFIAVKGQIEHLEYIGENTMNTKNDFRINLIEYQIDSTKYRLAAIDIYGNPLISRKSALDDIINYSTENKVDFIIGDFNTPYESVYFNRYKDDYFTFRDYQSGFTFTWPSILPLLELDQVWSLKKHHAIKMEKYFHDNSDHAILISNFTSE